MTEIGRNRRTPIVACCLFAGCVWLLAAAQSFSDDRQLSRSKQPKLKRNISMKTLGGRQFWGDVCVFHQWRIQKHVLTGHYRLLDGEDYRHAGGTLRECRDKLEQIKKSRKLPEMKGRAVILIHGIVRSSKSFRKLHNRLKHEGCQVFAFDYPSTQIEIPDSAGYLQQVIESMDGIEQIDLVVHSMGGLVVRSYLASHHDKRIRRMVMIGVPNLGARMADRVKSNLLYRAVFGPAGQQLVSNPEGLIANLPTPDFEFGIIAGARGTTNGFNVLVPGDDDGTISVDSTRLPGAADFITVRCLHSFMMSSDEVVGCTMRFLKEGRFREKGNPRPIPGMEKKGGADKAEKRPSDKAKSQKKS